VFEALRALAPKYRSKVILVFIGSCNKSDPDTVLIVVGAVVVVVVDGGVVVVVLTMRLVVCPRAVCWACVMFWVAK